MDLSNGDIAQRFDIMKEEARKAKNEKRQLRLEIRAFIGSICRRMDDKKIPSLQKGVQKALAGEFRVSPSSVTDYKKYQERFFNQYASSEIIDLTAT